MDVVLPVCEQRGSRVQLGDLGLETLQEEHRNCLAVCASALAGRRPSWGYGFSFQRKSVRALSGEPRDCLAGIAVRKLDRPWNGVRPLRVQFEAQVCARSCASPTSSYSTLLYSTLLLFRTTLLRLDVNVCANTGTQLGPGSSAAPNTGSVCRAQSVGNTGTLTDKTNDGIRLLYTTSVRFYTGT